MLMEIPAQPSPASSNQAAVQNRQTVAKPAGAPAQGDTNVKIEFPCPKCGLPVRTPASVAGKKGKCPSCGAVVQIPLQSTGAVAAEEKSPSPPKTEAKTSTAKARQIQFHCPRCKGLMRTPARALGKRVKCPGCGALLSIPSRTSGKRRPQAKDSGGLTPLADATPELTPLDETPDLMPLDEAPALMPLDETSGLAPLDDASGLVPLDDASGSTPSGGIPELIPIEDDPLGSAAGFEDPLGGLSPMSGTGGPDPFGDLPPAMASAPAAPLGTNPYQAPSYGATGRRSRGPSPATVKAPAIAMIGVSALSLVSTVIYGVVMAIGAFAGAGDLPNQDRVAHAAGYVVGFILGLGLACTVQIIVINGGVKMMRFENYRLAMTAAILLLLPCTACWAGLPIGVWALVVLCLGHVREAFKS